MGLHEAGEAVPWHRARHGQDDRGGVLALVLAALIRSEARLARIETKVDRMTAQQDQLNALVAQEGVDLDDIAAGLSLLGAGIQNVALEIQALQNANPAVDFTGLQAKVSQLSQARGLFDTAVANVQALDPSSTDGTAPGAPPVDDPADPADPAAPADPDPVASPSVKSAK